MTKYFTKNENGEYEEAKALSQEQVDDLIETRLKRQKESQFGDYEELKSKAEEFDALSKDFESKLQEANQKNESLAGELTKAKLETSKVLIMSEFKLGEDMAEFVIGENEEEMRKRAEKLSKNVKPQVIELNKAEKKENDNPNGALAKKLFSVQGE